MHAVSKNKTTKKL